MEGQGMPNYRRAYAPGASWFFTVNLLQRRNNDLLVRHIDLLRDAVPPVCDRCVGGVAGAYALCVDAATGRDGLFDALAFDQNLVLSCFAAGRISLKAALVAR
jgi:hypothetical protein